MLCFRFCILQAPTKVSLEVPPQRLLVSRSQNTSSSVPHPEGSPVHVACTEAFVSLRISIGTESQARSACFAFFLRFLSFVFSFPYCCRTTCRRSFSPREWPPNRISLRARSPTFIALFASKSSSPCTWLARETERPRVVSSIGVLTDLKP